MLSVCGVSTIGGSVGSISIPASKDSKDHQETDWFMSNQVNHCDSMFSVCQVSTIGG